MGYKKVSEFEEIFNIKDSDMFLIDRGGQPKAIKAINMMKYFGSGGGGGAEPSGTLSITISGNNTVDNNAWFTGSRIAYDTNSGAYGWLYGRDLKEIKITYNGHDYVYWDTTETKPAYFFQFIDDDNAVIIMGGGADSSKFDFYIVAGSDNATVENLPSALKHDDVVGAVYDYETLTTTESDFPMTLEFTNMAVVEPEPTATFDFTLTDDDFGTIEGVGLSAYRKTFSGLSDFFNGKDFDELKLQLNDGEELPNADRGGNSFSESGSTDTLKALIITTDDMVSQGFNLILYMSLAENASTSFGSMGKDEVILARYNPSGAPSALPDSYMPFTVKFNYYGYVEPSPEPEPEPSGNSFSFTVNDSDYVQISELGESAYGYRKTFSGISDFIKTRAYSKFRAKVNNGELLYQGDDPEKPEGSSNGFMFGPQSYKVYLFMTNVNGTSVYAYIAMETCTSTDSGVGIAMQKDEIIVLSPEGSGTAEIPSELLPLTIELIYVGETDTSFTAMFDQTNLVDTEEIEFPCLIKTCTGLSDFLTNSNLDTLRVKFNGTELSRTDHACLMMLMDYEDIVQIPVFILNITFNEANPVYGFNCYIPKENETQIPDLPSLNKDDVILFDGNAGEISSSLYPITIEFIRE